ncbi:MAG TPA: response regulator [Nocardioidaceae bacterium]|nr:response regulator [Nocardioidaceae bacterium]
MSVPLANPQLRAVVVDDTPDLRALLCLALESSGEIVVVGEAGNGLDGVEEVRNNQPDIVLLDLAMPVMDGLEALPQMRALCPEATIVVLSGFGATAMASRALAAGADGYLQKGASATAILDYVRSLVGYAPSGLRLLPSPAPAAPPRHGDVAELALDLAPFGVIVLRDVPELTVMSANQRALALLGIASPVGHALTTALPELGLLVRRLSATEHGTDELWLGTPRRVISVSVRHAEGRVMVYLDQHEDAGDGEMLRRAIATTAHEIRTPVTVLVGVADTLNERGDELTPEMRQRLRAAVLRQAKLLDSMTADLLTAAQAHHGTLRVDLERIDAKSVLDAVLDGSEDVDIHAGRGIHVVADPFRLEQMITNLLGNARKYGTAPYVVRAHTEGDEVLIEVVDQGPGVPDTFVPLLFDEFTRAAGTTARGTGLGLYVVRSLAEAQGGSVGYRREGGSTIFTIVLPLD